jgi:hypothetical protein
MKLSNLAAGEPAPDIESIRAALADPANIGPVRAAIVDLIFRHLETARDSLDGWQRVHFLDAISALALNVNSLQQPTTSWLRLCLVDLEKAITPEYQRCGELPPRNIDLELVTYERLMDALDSIGRRIG